METVDEKTKIKFINHASILISNNKVSLLCDPWFSGSAFHKGWDLIYQNQIDMIEETLRGATHIWISHEHPDHFSIDFFKNQGQLIRKNKIKILIQVTKDKRVYNYLTHNKFSVVELKSGKKEFIEDNFSVTCIKDGFYDSALFIESYNDKVLNLNDCEINTIAKAKEIYKLTGNIDVLLTQFSYAAWKGGEENERWRKDAALSKLKTVELQMNIFRPKVTLPFASFIYFSNELNFYLNRDINSPEKVVSFFAGSDNKVQFLKPGDIFSGVYDEALNDNAVSFWVNQYTALAGKPLHTYTSVEFEKLFKSFKGYIKRIKSKNSILLMKLMRIISPIAVFKPVVIELIDLKIKVNVDYLYQKFEITGSSPVLGMHSESLNFIFTNSFGFDTLTVNGCFEEKQDGGFIRATKSLAIENLNNLGIEFNLGILLNLTIIKVFFSRLYYVAKKMKP